MWMIWMLIAFTTCSCSDTVCLGYRSCLLWKTMNKISYGFDNVDSNINLTHLQFEVTACLIATPHPRASPKGGKHPKDPSLSSQSFAWAVAGEILHSSWYWTVKDNENGLSRGRSTHGSRLGERSRRWGVRCGHVMRAHDGPSPTSLSSTVKSFVNISVALISHLKRSLSSGPKNRLDVPQTKAEFANDDHQSCHLIDTHVIPRNTHRTQSPAVSRWLRSRASWSRVLPVAQSLVFVSSNDMIIYLIVDEWTSYDVVSQLWARQTRPMGPGAQSLSPLVVKFSLKPCLNWCKV